MIEIIVSVFLGAVIGGIIGSFVRDWGIRNRLLALEDRVETKINTIASQKGVNKRQVIDEEKQMAIMDAAMMFKQGGDVKDILSQLAVKYPNAASQFMKEFGI